MEQMTIGVIGGSGLYDIAGLKDINAREALVLTTLAVMVLLLGIWPAPLIEVMDVSVANLVEHISQQKY